MDSTIIVVSGGPSQFNVYLPKNAKPQDIAGTLMATTNTEKANRWAMPHFDAGQVAADLITNLNPRCRARLIANEASILHAASHLVTLTYNGHKDAFMVKLVAVKNGKLATIPSFSGTLGEFQQYRGDLGGFEKAIGKTISFTYKGGSRPGKKRVAKIEAVEPDGVGYVLRGTDLEKYQESQGKEGRFRNYKSSQIEGDILVIN